MWRVDTEGAFKIRTNLALTMWNDRWGLMLVEHLLCDRKCTTCLWAAFPAPPPKKKKPKHFIKHFLFDGYQLGILHISSPNFNYNSEEVTSIFRWEKTKLIKVKWTVTASQSTSHQVGKVKIRDLIWLASKLRQFPQQFSRRVSGLLSCTRTKFFHSVPLLIHH